MRSGAAHAVAKNKQTTCCWLESLNAVVAKGACRPSAGPVDRSERTGESMQCVRVPAKCEGGAGAACVGGVSGSYLWRAQQKMLFGSEALPLLVRGTQTLWPFRAEGCQRARERWCQAILCVVPRWA